MGSNIIGKRIWRFIYESRPDFQKADLRVPVSTEFLKSSEDETDPGAMIVVKFDIQAEDIDDLHVAMEDAFELSFDKAPDDYEKTLKEILTNRCFPEACSDLDKALAGMGKPPMNLGDGTIIEAS